MEAQPQADTNNKKLYDALNDLYDPKTRGEALSLLSKTIKLDPVVLWNAFGIVTILIQEICSSYPYLNPCTLTDDQCKRLMNVLSLIQCMATSDKTYSNILQTGILTFIYPLLKIEGNRRSLSDLRTTAFSLIGAVSKLEYPEVIPYFIRTNLLSICLENLKNSSLNDRMIMTYILQRIVQDKNGLEHICSSNSICNAFCAALAEALTQSTNNKVGARLVKHVVRCFHALSKKPLTHDLVAKYYPAMIDQESVQKDMEAPIKELHKDIKNFIK